MNVQETENKLIKFCEGLFRENLISQEDLKKCHIAFKQNNTSNLEDVTNTNTVLNNDLKNYGMHEDQSFNNINLMFSQNKFIVCKLHNFQRKSINREESKRIKFTLYSTKETNTTMQYLYIKNLDDLDNKDNTNYDDKLVKNITFKLEKVSANEYIIINYFTGELLTVTDDKKLILTKNNKSELTLFKLHNHDKHYRFESIKYPNNYISASNPISLTTDSSPTQYWKIELISKEDDELDKLSSTSFNATNTRALIQKFIKEYTNTRLKFMIINAKIKYIEILQSKAKDTLGRSGLIMEYIRSRVNNNELKLTEQQILRLEASIYNEFINNEIEHLENTKNNLRVEAQKINGSLIVGNINRVKTINNTIDKAIENTKSQLETLNEILDKVNSESRNLYTTSTQLNKHINKQSDLNFRSNKNTELITSVNKKNNTDYYVYISLMVIITCFIIYLSYKLVNKYKVEFAIKQQTS